MRYLVGLVCVLALGVMALVGCSETSGARLCEGPGSCDDGDVCTEDLCPVVGEVCSYVPVTCNDYSDCTADSCDSSVGCVQTAVADETPCAGGTCQEGVCQLTGSVLPCTDQGIRNAVAAGGGPYTFDCDGPTTVALEADIIMEKDVALDGERQLTVDVGGDPEVALQFGIEEGASVQLRAMNVRRGVMNALNNRGTLRLEDCSVTQAGARGVDSVGSLELIRSTVADNQEEGVFSEGPTLIVNSTVSGNGGVGILNDSGQFTLTGSTVSSNVKDGIVNDVAGTATLTNCTVSGNGLSDVEDFGIGNSGTMTLTNCTVSGHDAGPDIGVANDGTLTVTNTLVDGDCVTDDGAISTSNGYNIESPGNTCGFDQTGDQPGVTEAELNLGALADNGGPTDTHKPGDGGLGEGSRAIDRIPEADCQVTEDQRGEPRPETGGTMCDVGSVEVQP